MTRAGPGARGDPGGIVWCQLACGRVEAEQEDPVEPFVGNRQDLAAGIEDDVVRVGACLLLSVWAAVAGQRHEVGTRAEGAVALDGQHTDRAGGVIGGGQPSAGGVDREVDRVLAAAGLPVQRLDVPGLPVDGVGADLVEIGMHRVEHTLVSIQDEEGGVDGFEQLFVGPVARGPVDPVDVDAATMAFAIRRGECADIGEHGRCRLRLGVRTPCAQRHGAGSGQRCASLQDRAPLELRRARCRNVCHCVVLHVRPWSRDCPRRSDLPSAVISV